MEKLTLIFLCFGVLIPYFITCAAVDTIAVKQIIKDGDTIVSAGGNFELGFFSPGTSKNRYVGIWYKKISTCTVVWVANKETPLINKSGELRISQAGLQLFDGNNTVIWSTNSSGSISLVAQLQDTGNLVLLDGGNSIWQSFDYPGDTLLPGMKISIDRHLTSWKSDDDPSAGPYVLQVDPDGYPQMLRKPADLWSRFGPWNGVTFSGMPNLGQNSTQFVFTETERYFEYELVSNSILSRMHLDPDGKVEYLNWNNQTQNWMPLSAATYDNCALYNTCGPNGVCDINNAPSCNCLEGFDPRSREEWDKTDWSSGCQRREPLACGYGDIFSNKSGIQFPDTKYSWHNQTMTLLECEAACRRNCSCVAYANSDIRNGGSGCLLWFGDLMDIRANDGTQSLYLRMHASELTGPKTQEQRIIIVMSTSLGLIFVFLILALYLARRKKKGSQKIMLGKSILTVDAEYSMESQFEDDEELAYFSLAEISKSTKDFSSDKKLGEGGFGPVYMGVLDDGRNIAVKKLSKTSRQGINEFKNELKFIAKLQHRNLVKLLGYSNEGDESMLIYEYMPHKSLDLLIFDNIRSLTLDWCDRFRIIHGTVRGLVYLHHDSRFKIVHRDLKASNILLDADMNPKISDFGLARMFRDQENQANTSRVVGTLGYISPEYAIDGTFSEKSDVFSFGVLMLEIVSGKTNRGFSNEKEDDSLLAYAWRLYKEGAALELLSARMRESCVESEVLRSIHIGLLCVQHLAKDRPTMLSVALMFDQDDALPPPKRPAFFAEGIFLKANQISINDVTITTLKPR